MIPKIHTKKSAMIVAVRKMLDILKCSFKKINPPVIHPIILLVFLSKKQEVSEKDGFSTTNFQQYLPIIIIIIFIV